MLGGSEKAGSILVLFLRGVVGGVGGLKERAKGGEGVQLQMVGVWR